jgi:hypothetical protein
MQFWKMQDFLTVTNRHRPFDKTRTAYKTTRPTILLLWSVYSSRGNIYTELLLPLT